jgi:1-acyl-sn-glycerol-3-phosphate acyltransferase
MALFSGARGAVRDLAGALLPMSVRDLEREIAERLEKAPLQLNEYGFDPFGFHPATAAKTLVPGLLLYRYWFRAETHDIERVPRGRVMLVANHAGQLPYDGVMLTVAMLMEAEPPRLCRGMGEYFIWRLPFGSIAAARGGATSGTPLNCLQLLEREECVMVFPEGARGINKPFRQRYQLQEFGLGFLRLALETRTPIVPVGIVGSEEQQPGFANLQGAARVLGLPSLPITVSFPLLGPAGLLFALPVKYHLHFGEPLEFEGHPSDEDAVIQEKVDAVRHAIEALLERGLASRAGVFR